MNIDFAPVVIKKINILKQKDLRQAKMIEKQLALFIKNPKHPSLRIHKLTGELQNLWSLSINKSIRMSYFLEKDRVYFIKIGTHDEVYKK